MSGLLRGESLASFVTLTFLEIVLSIDNLVFLAIAIQKVAPERRALASTVGQSLAMVLRLAMLAALVWMTRLEAPLFHLAGRAVGVKDLVLIAGGLFLLVKGTTEIHDNLEGPDEPASGTASAASSLGSVIAQIAVINIVFSIDSVVTAVGMTNELPVMAAAVIAATGVMLFAARPVARFIHARPTMKMLALAFILLIGLALVADGIGFHIPRGYVYFAIAFSLGVEALNAAYRRSRTRGGEK
jgi:predicted tellurium resistance membrane protein TerC